MGILKRLFQTILLTLSVVLFVGVSGVNAADAPSAPGGWGPGPSVEQQRIRARRVERSRYAALVREIGELPRVPVAVADLSVADSRAIERNNKLASANAPVQMGTVKALDIEVDLSGLNHSSVAGNISAQVKPYQGGVAKSNAVGQSTWAARVEVTGSSSIRLRFDSVSLPPDAVLYIYNEAGDVRGPYGGGQSSFWTHSIPISEGVVYVQLSRLSELAGNRSRRIPRPTSGNEESIEKSQKDGFHIGAILLSDISVMESFCDYNDSCIVDGSCYSSADWSAIEGVRRAIAHYNYIKNGGGYICTGGLVNDKDTETYIPYFLTANHCVSSSAVAKTIETYFDYRTSSCGASCISPGASDTVGADLLDTDAADDHTLLRLHSKPGGKPWYLGWTSTQVAQSEGFSLYRISHPNGAPQAFSTGTVWTDAPKCSDMPRGAYIYSRAQVGSTQGGSSGSPVLNDAGQIVGQLYGKCGPDPEAGCDPRNATVDGAFANYYPRVKKWLAASSGASNKPDLIVTSISSPYSATAGVKISVGDVIVKNQGSAQAAASRLWFFLSSDSTITLSDIRVGDWLCDIPALNAGETNTVCSGSIRLPEYIASGTYHLGAYADGEQVVDESSESNNGLAASNTISITGGSGTGCSGTSRGLIYKSYIGYYGRCPERAGLEYWCSRLDSAGGNLSAIIAAFGTSDEYTSVYGSLSDGNIIQRLYENMFRRYPEGVGMNFYLRRLNELRGIWYDDHRTYDGASEYALSRIALDVLNGASGNDLTTINNKMNACPSF